VVCTVTSAPIGSTITPFVVEPDGTVIVGSALTIADPQTLISVTSTEYGTYEVGLEEAAGVITSATADCTVVSNPGGQTALLPLTVTPNLASNGQVAEPFVYGAPGIP
jgi:hypothetical protein